MKIEHRYEPGGLRAAQAPDPDSFIQVDVPVCVELEREEAPAITLEYEVEGLQGGGRESDRIEEGCDTLRYKIMREHFLDGRQLRLSAKPEGARVALWHESFLMSRDSDGRPALRRAAA
jgi:hypothetical protein